MSGLTHDQLVTLVVAAAVFVLSLPAGFMVGRWWYSEPEPDRPSEAELEAEFGMYADEQFFPLGPQDKSFYPHEVVIDPPGPDEMPTIAARDAGGPGVQPFEGPVPGSDWYRWTHRDPIRHQEQPLTVIDWEKVSWVERITLLGWDEARRLEREGWEIVAGERDPDPPDWSVTIEVPEWAAA